MNEKGWRDLAQRGVIALLFVPALWFLVAVAALAVDITRLVVVRNELQTAADAAALAGAARLKNYLNPSWQEAKAAAEQAISQNVSDKVPLSDAVVEIGFWPINGNGPWRSHDSLPLLPAPHENPAVRVTITRSGTENGGEPPYFFAGWLGIDNAGVSASAISVVSTPGFAGKGSLFPMVLNLCVFEQFWENGAPVNPAQPVRIGSAYHYDNCAAGQWTSLDLDSQSAYVAKSLLTTGNEGELVIGDSAFIQAGTENSIYKSVQQMIDLHGGQWDVLMPVVDSPDLTENGKKLIVAFAPFRLKAAVGGSGKYVEGFFIQDFKAQNTSGGGEANVGFFGATTPAILAD